MAIIDESNPASTAPGQTPAGTTASAPTGGEPQAAEPTAAEPVAAEPVAAEPVAAPEPEPAPAFPSADEFGWDTWDGTPDALPEELQSWHGQFNTRWDAQSQESAAELAKAQAEAAQWQRYYESVFSGEEDPRIAERTEKLAVLQKVHDEYKAQTQSREQAYTELLEKDADRYLMSVKAEHGPYMDSLTSEQGDQIMGLLDHDYELHDALVISQSGPEAMAEAVKLREQGTPPDVALRLIAAEYSTQQAAAAAAPRMPSPAAQVMAGADGSAARPAPAPKAKRPVGRRANLQAAARAAIQKHQR